MTKFKTLSNQDLDHSLGSLVKLEREILSEIILHIQEVSCRRLYLKFNYSSLFEYLTKHHGYANGSAQRRIDAARLSIEVPTVIADLESGEINLSQVSLVQKSIRQKAQPVSKETKFEIVQSLKQKSVLESQVIVAQKLEIEIKAQPKISHQADRSVRLEVTFSQEQWEKMQHMRDLLSHSIPDGSWNQILEYVADKFIRSKTKQPVGDNKAKLLTDNNKAKLRAVNNKAKIQVKDRKSISLSTLVDVGNFRSKSNSQAISMNTLRRQVMVRDKCCQHRISGSEKLCGSTWQLQADHIKPKWAGGEDRSDNLQLLCAEHNREKYRQQAQIRRI